ncbi:MAG: restriction endonuclease subunit S [Gammaproteobacteria bacterium]|nr:restriction endonuclease subunit S [Gammaproteobacteria bacterium]
MSAFPTKSLSSVCDISMGQAPKGGSYNTTRRGYPLIAGAGDFGELTPTPKKYTNAPTKLSSPGDLILCIRATIGDLNWSDKEYCLGRGVAGLRAKDAVLSQAYLGHWLDHSAPVLRTKGRGATFLQVSKGDIASLQIPLPPLAEQKRIARILDAVDALRTKRREALAQLDALLQSTFLDMFGDPVTNPMGWEVKWLKEMLGEKCTNGAYYPKDAYSSVGTRMVHMANAFYGVVNPNEVKRVDAPLADIEKYGLLPTDILVSRRSLNYEGSAKPCLIPETDEPLIFESSLIRVRPDREIVLTIYLFHYLSNDRARAKYVFPLVTRSTISGISQSNLMKVKVVLPPLDLQFRFTAVVESIERQKARQSTHLAELDTLFASLQSRAFRGDL